MILYNYVVYSGVHVSTNSKACIILMSHPGSSNNIDFFIHNILKILTCRISKKIFFAPEKVKAALDFTKI